MGFSHLCYYYYYFYVTHFKTVERKSLVFILYESKANASQ